MPQSAMLIRFIFASALQHLGVQKTILPAARAATQPVPYCPYRLRLAAPHQKQMDWPSRPAAEKRVLPKQTHQAFALTLLFGSRAILN